MHVSCVYVASCGSTFTDHVSHARAHTSPCSAFRSARRCTSSRSICTHPRFFHSLFTQSEMLLRVNCVVPCDLLLKLLFKLLLKLLFKLQATEGSPSRLIACIPYLYLNLMVPSAFRCRLQSGQHSATWSSALRVAQG